MNADNIEDKFKDVTGQMDGVFNSLKDFAAVLPEKEKQFFSEGLKGMMNPETFDLSAIINKARNDYSSSK